jgi:hypothetical protein
MEFLTCLSVSFEMIGELIDIRAKIKNNQDCYDDLIAIMRNYEKYNRKEKKMIRETLKIFLEHNKTCNSSFADVKNNDNTITEQKINDV